MTAPCWPEGIVMTDLAAAPEHHLIRALDGLGGKVDRLTP
jgi:hypothetical protein